MDFCSSPDTRRAEEDCSGQSELLEVEEQEQMGHEIQNALS